MAYSYAKLNSGDMEPCVRAFRTGNIPENVKPARL